MLGDFNVTIRNKQSGYTLGKYGLGESKDRGNTLAELTRE